MSRGSYARKTEVKRDENVNESTPALNASLRHHLACECQRYFEVRGCASQIVNEISKGTMTAPASVVKHNARQVVAKAIKRGLITKCKS